MINRIRYSKCEKEEVLQLMKIDQKLLMDIIKQLMITVFGHFMRGTTYHFPQTIMMVAVEGERNGEEDEGYCGSTT